MAIAGHLKQKNGPCYGHRGTEARGLLAITEQFRTGAPRVTSHWTLRLGLATTFLLLLVITPASGAVASSGCKSSGYACTIDGYNATTVNNSWAARYYGSDTKGGIGSPPHNCTLFAAWMLAHNGLADPGRSWLRRARQLVKSHRFPGVGQLRRRHCRLHVQCLGTPRGTDRLHPSTRPRGATLDGGSSDQTSTVVASHVRRDNYEIRSPKRRTTDSSRRARTTGPPRERSARD
jgi:hypothetical protein